MFVPQMSRRRGYSSSEEEEEGRGGRTPKAGHFVQRSVKGLGLLSRFQSNKQTVPTINIYALRFVLYSKKNKNISTNKRSNSAQLHPPPSINGYGGDEEGFVPFA